MRGNSAIGLAAAMLVYVAPASAQSPVRTSPATLVGEAIRGEQLYQNRCGACHSLDADRVGPRHRGVVGRRAASVPGYRYTPALRQRALTWDEPTLDQWLANPTSLVPGTAMGIRVPSAQDRADIIAYLRDNSSPAPR
ncbi:MAG TPA: c-type cytochrome [Vineibacter sp.]|nr:c-type cytochrome [Vineibacter sp.]